MAATPTVVKAGLLFLLSGLLLAGGGLVLGLGLGGFGGLLTGAVGLLAGVVLGILGLFSALSHTTNTYFRFTLPILLGTVVGVAGLAGGFFLGGMLGAGVGLVSLGLGSLLVGLGVLAGSEPRNPSPAPPVTP